MADILSQQAQAEHPPPTKIPEEPEFAEALRATEATNTKAALWTTIVAILLLAAGVLVGVLSYSMGGRHPEEQHVVAEVVAERFAAASKVAEEIEREHRASTTVADRGARVSETRAGVQEALDQHRQQLEEVRARLQYDSEYFASLILLSAHEGLLGNSTEEWYLLIQYWREFSTHVEEEQANLIFQGIDELVFEAGLFFQQLVDDGEYDAAAYFDYSDDAAEDAFLKPALIGQYHWPKFAAFWPFDREQRDAFAFSFGITSDGSKDPKRFEQRQPRHPHDYLEIAALRKTYDYLRRNGHNPENPDFVDVARIRGSILRYYDRTAFPDDMGARYLEGYPWSFLHTLETCGPEEWPEASLKDLILGLQFLSKSPVHHEYSGKAAKLLEDYEAHEALLTGNERPTSGAPVLSIKIERPEIIVVLSLGEEQSNSRARDFIRRNLASGIRGLPPTTSFNIYLAGEVNEKKRLTAFPSMQHASRNAKLVAIQFINQDLSELNSYDLYKRDPKTSLSGVLTAVIESVRERDASKVEIVLVISEISRQDDIFEHESEPAIWKSLSATQNLPAIHVISTGDAEEYPYLLRLSEITGGSAFRLEKTNSLVAGEVEIVTWK